MPVIRKFLDLSTGHLRLSTREWLKKKLAWNSSLGPYGAVMPYGFIVYAHDDLGGEDWPKELEPIFKRANEHDCSYVMFDADADRDEVLAWFEDGEEEIAA